jgi:cobalt-zinc-cadmium efflux system membrane fusion protein
MKKQALAVVMSLAMAACSKTEQPKAAGKEEKSAGNLIHMGLAAQKNVGLEVAPAEVHDLAERLQVTGTVQPVDSRVSQVRSMARGRIQRVLSQVGDRVAAGQDLGLMENLEAAEVAAQLASARADLQRLKVLLAVQVKHADRDRRLAEIGAGAAKDSEQSKAEVQALEESIRSQESVLAGLDARLKRLGRNDAEPGGPATTALKAPFSGIVIKSVPAPGEVVDSGTPLFTVADISKVWVQAEVYEKDLGRLRLGLPAEIRVDTYPDRPFHGNVSYISDVLDPMTRTARVRCEVANAAMDLKLDMYATVYLPTTFRRRALAVPVGALQQLEQAQVVFVQRSVEAFETRPVRLGRTLDGLVEVLEGLKEGERIVVAGSFHLKSIVAGKDLGEE